MVLRNLERKELRREGTTLGLPVSATQKLAADFPLVLAHAVDQSTNWLADRDGYPTMEGRQYQSTTCARPQASPQSNFLLPRGSCLYNHCPVGAA